MSSLTLSIYVAPSTQEFIKQHIKKQSPFSCAYSVPAGLAAQIFRSASPENLGLTSFFNQRSSPERALSTYVAPNTHDFVEQQAKKYKVIPQGALKRVSLRVCFIDESIRLNI